MNKVLLILTGGTICMERSRETGALRPATEESFRAAVPELFETPDTEVHLLSFTPLIDSSDVNPQDWKKMAQTIAKHYDDYDGFVILHGTDTMSYSGSALSFMLEGLNKPVVFTGSQLPIGVLRSDAKENLLTAIEIASARDENNDAIVPEVTIYFESRLFRANRTTKRNAEHFAAFKSYNYPPLAQAGLHITYNVHLVHYSDPKAQLKLHTDTDNHVVVLKLFPGITEQVVRSILHIRDLKAVVLETYGAGNAPSYKWLYKLLKEAVDKGIIIVNKTQCSTGMVDMELYEVSSNLIKAGVLSGFDITTEALLSKLMYLFGEHPDNIERVKILLQKDLCGEITIHN